MDFKPDPLGVPRHALVVYLLGLCIISGLSNLLGEPTAGSVESTLRPEVQVTWSVILVLGGGASLVGMYWQGDPRTGLLMKRFGYMSLAIAAAAYAGVLILLVGDQARFIGGIVIGFAFACMYATWVVNKAIRATIVVNP